jgi:hypothetical protein
LLRQAEALAESLKALVQDGNDQGRKEMLRLLAELLVARENAQRCAVEAAPYVHAKIQPISAQPPTTVREIVLTIPEARNGEDRRYRDGYSTGPEANYVTSGKETAN